MTKTLAGIMIIGAAVGFLLWNYANGSGFLPGNPYGCSSCARSCPPQAGK